MNGYKMPYLDTRMYSSLQSVLGPLDKAVSQLDPRTVQHAYQIMQQRRLQDTGEQDIGEDMTLGAQHLTADFPVYNLKGKQRGAWVHIATGEHNLALASPSEAMFQFGAWKNFRLTREEEDYIINADSTLSVPHRSLGLKKHGGGFAYLKIFTRNPYRTLRTIEQRLVAQRPYGQENAFDHTMESLLERGIRSTIMWFLDEDYVTEYAAKQAIARLGGIGKSSDGSHFCADLCYPQSPYMFLRGALKPELELVKKAAMITLSTTTPSNMRILEGAIATALSCKTH